VLCCFIAYTDTAKSHIILVALRDASDKVGGQVD
jgi:hypothetical protein